MAMKCNLGFVSPDLASTPNFVLRACDHVDSSYFKNRVPLPSWQESQCLVQMLLAYGIIFLFPVSPTPQKNPSNQASGETSFWLNWRCMWDTNTRGRMHQSLLLLEGFLLSAKYIKHLFATTQVLKVKEKHNSVCCNRNPLQLRKTPRLYFSRYVYLTGC